MSVSKGETRYLEQLSPEGRVNKLLEGLLKHINWLPPKDGHILDAGAFTAVTSADLVKHYWDLGINVTACDLNIYAPTEQYCSPNLLRVIEDYKVSGYDIEKRLDVIEADYTDALPLTSSSVDAVFLLNNLSYELYYYPEILADPISIRDRLSEVQRVLKVGGILVVWSEYREVPTFVLKKQECGLVAAISVGDYFKYLVAVYGQDTGIYDLTCKSIQDTFDAEVIESALRDHPYMQEGF